MLVLIIIIRDYRLIEIVFYLVKIFYGELLFSFSRVDEDL